MKTVLCVMFLMTNSVFSFADYASKYVQGYASSYVLGSASSTVTYASNYNPITANPTLSDSYKDTDSYKDSDRSKEEDTYQGKVSTISTVTTTRQSTTEDGESEVIITHKLLPTILEPRKVNSTE
ncbi:MAG: hypothetical protein WCG16_03130 [Methylococcales bacterium]